jgi:GH35 family endo-1,4-beta-xylanase
VLQLSRQIIMVEDYAMDQLGQYRKIVRRLIEDFASYGLPPEGVRTEAIVDT